MLRVPSILASAAVKTALEGVTVVEVDLTGVRTEEQLESAMSKGLGFSAGLRSSLKQFDAAAKDRPTVLLLTGIDGCSGSAEEEGVAGRLRGELQGVHNAAVMYSAIDSEFLGRVLGNPLGPFFKQAVIVDL